MASMAAFQPHGLIKTPIEQVLYHKAHIANIHAGIADPKEHETVALMTAILYSNVFTTRENFIVSPEQPPTPTSDRRCDIVVRYLESGSQNIRALCFGECKRASKNRPFSLKALEEQAFEYCKLYLDHEEMPFVYAATMAGAHVRLWGCWPDRTEMEPFWGSYKTGDWRQYKDVGDDVAAQEIEAGFARMKRFPPRPHAGQTSDTYGTLYQPGVSYQSTTSQPATSGYQPSTSGDQPSMSGYQPSTSGYQPSYAASYPLPSTVLGGASTGQYMYSILAAQTKPNIQLGSDVNEPMDEVDEESEGNENNDDDNEETSGGFDMGEDVGAQQAASKTGSKYHLVHVTKKTHTLGGDEYIFKDSKGKKRSTKRKDWQKTTLNGQSAWRYHHYVSYEIPK